MYNKNDKKTDIEKALLMENKKSIDSNFYGGK